MFDLAQFVDQCSAAAASRRPQDAVEDVVRAALEDPGRVSAALGPPTAVGQTTFLHTATLTVQRIVWGPGTRTEPHEHRMWVVSGVITGREENRTYRLHDQHLVPDDERVLEAGGVVSFTPDVVHSVYSPHADFTDALHVYGGDILTATRTAWDSSGRAHPFDGAAVRRVADAYNARTQALGRLPTASEGEAVLREARYGD